MEKQESNVEINLSKDCDSEIEGEFSNELLDGEEIHEVIDAVKESDLEETKKQKIIKTYTEFYSGALPHPMLLKQFGEVGDHVVDTILEMAVDNQKIEIETRESHNKFNHKRLDYTARDNLLGAIFAFILLTLLIVLGTILIWNGKDFAGYGFAVTGVLGVVRLFIPTLKNKSERNTEESTEDDE